MRNTLALALAVLATAGVAACEGSAGSAAPASATEPAPLHWGACPNPETQAGLRCAKLAVPLDYRHPDGEKIEITISRLASKNPAKRRGVLLVNPGGPGLPGLSVPAVLPYPQQLRDGYDIIGFDARGAGQSTPLTCGLTAAHGAVASNPPYPHSSADVAKQAKTAKTLAKLCNTSKTAVNLPFTTTANTARDMDRIRAALGEP